MDIIQNKHVQRDLILCKYCDINWCLHSITRQNHAWIIVSLLKLGGIWTGKMCKFEQTLEFENPGARLWLQLKPENLEFCRALVVLNETLWLILKSRFSMALVSDLWGVKEVAFLVWSHWNKQSSSETSQVDLSAECWPFVRGSLWIRQAPSETSQVNLSASHQVSQMKATQCEGSH